VSPGAQILSLRNIKSGKSTVVPIPVRARTSTYVNLTETKSVKISGNVLNASSSDLKGVSGALVKIIGLKGSETITRQSGKFELSEIVRFGHYPLYVESEVQEEFTHRYRLGEDVKSIQLYRFSNQKIDHWIKQLHGGLSPESAMIIGGFGDTLSEFPTSIDSNPDLSALKYPGVTRIVDNSSLTPETYSLSERGQLQVETPLSEISARFLSVQLPRGIVSSRIENQQKQTIWSQLVPTDPGIVYVISGQ
jgi:hypothetical protein